jgi:ATP-dependent DNA helicase RecG
LTAHNRASIDITGASVEQRRAHYPIAALQQLTHNAILHRTYEGTNTPALVYWFDDRIEITSPGGPYGEVTVDNFGDPGVTDYWNPNLAEAMRALGYERWMARIPEVYREAVLQELPESLPPTVAQDPNAVALCVTTAV